MSPSRPIQQSTSSPTGVLYVGPSLGRSLLGLLLALTRAEDQGAQRS